MTTCSPELISLLSISRWLRFSRKTIWRKHTHFRECISQCETLTCMKNHEKKLLSKRGALFFCHRLKFFFVSCHVDWLIAFAWLRNRIFHYSTWFVVQFVHLHTERSVTDSVEQCNHQWRSLFTFWKKKSRKRGYGVKCEWRVVICSFVCSFFRIAWYCNLLYWLL